jgi:tetratricopeptide (TPR) repeat protein
MLTAIKVSLVHRFLSGGIALALLTGGAVTAQMTESSALLAYEQGQSLLRAGNFRQAESTLYEAFQNSRADSGFYSADQLPILELILATAVLQRKWDDFGRRAEYYELLLHQLYRAESAPLAEGLARLADWHLAAAGAMASDHTVYHLIQSRTLLWRVVSGIEAAGGRHDPRLPPLLYRIVLNHFYLASSTQRRRLTSYELRSDTPTFISGWSQSSTASHRRHYRTGVELLQRIQEIFRQTGTEPYAESLLQLHLADWHLLFGRSGESFDSYKEAYRSLAESGLERKRIEAFFAAPRPLPLQTLHIAWEEDSLPAGQYFMYQPWSRTMPGVGLPRGPAFTILSEAGSGARVATPEGIPDPLVIAATIDVMGGAQDLRVIGNWSNGSGNQSVEYALSELSALQFRPAMESGERVPAEAQLLFVDF